jgi:hypothetical protein
LWVFDETPRDSITHLSDALLRGGYRLEPDPLADLATRHRYVTHIAAKRKVPFFELNAVDIPSDQLNDLGLCVVAVLGANVKDLVPDGVDWRGCEELQGPDYIPNVYEAPPIIALKEHELSKKKGLQNELID